MTKVALEFSGGLGKNIALTAVLPYLKEKPVLLCSFPAVFENNPFIEKFIPWPSPAYHILVDYDITKVDPYYLASYRRGEITLIEAIGKVLNVEIPFEAKPSLYFKAHELENAKSYLNRFERPIILFQPFGASTNPSDPGSTGQRSLSKKQALELARYLSLKGTVLVFRSLNQPYLPGFEHPDADLRFSLSLVQFADMLVGVDSWLGHAGAAFNKKGFFIFTSTDPKQLSYPLHTVVQPNKKCSLFPCRRPWPGVYDSFLCPFGLECQNFEITSIIPTLDNYLGEVLNEV